MFCYACPRLPLLSLSLYVHIWSIFTAKKRKLVDCGISALFLGLLLNTHDHYSLNSCLLITDICAHFNSFWGRQPSASESSGAHILSDVLFTNRLTSLVPPTSMHQCCYTSGTLVHYSRK